MNAVQAKSGITETAMLLRSAAGLVDAHQGPE